MARRNKRRRRSTYAQRTSWQPQGVDGPSLRPLIGWGVVLAAATAVAAYVLLFSPMFKANKVQIHGAESVSTEDISREVRDAAESRFGPLISESVIALDRGKMTERLKQKFPDLAQVNISTKLPRTIVVDVKERQTTLLWKSGESYHLVDRQGFAFDDAKPRDDLILVEDSTGLPVEKGKQVVSSKFIKVLEEIKAGMAATNQPLKSFRIPETTFEVHAITGQGYYAVFDTTRPIGNQIEALRRAVATAKPREYADLRIPGRVYVR